MPLILALSFMVCSLLGVKASSDAKKAASEPAVVRLAK